MYSTNDQGHLLDCNGQTLTPINDVVKDIANTSTLNKKPKLIVVQAYPGRYPFRIFNISLIFFGLCTIHFMHVRPHTHILHH